MTELGIFLFISLLIVLLILILPISGYVKAVQLEAKIPFLRCVIMSIRKTLKTELIEAVALSQKMKINVSVDVLEAHFLAGGSPLKCLEALDYAKTQSIPINFQQVSFADLAEKDLFKVIDKSKEIFEFKVSANKINDLKANVVTYNYVGRVENTFNGACFVEFEKGKIEGELKEKIEKYLKYSDATDKINVKSAILEIIIDEAYWKSKGFILKNQEIEIR